MEDKKFTLRLSGSEIESLETIKKLINVQTDSKAIRFVLMNYAELNRRYMAEKKEKLILADKLRILKEKIAKFMKGFQDLKEEL